MSNSEQKNQNQSELQLPPNGTKVTAMTYASLEYDREAEEVTGILVSEPGPFGIQCEVDEVSVDPTTVRAVTDA